MTFSDIVFMKVAANTIPVTESGCLLWLGRWKPYGTISVKDKQLYAHRAVWEATYGQIPNGMFVCHKCDVPPCVNIDHLFLGTVKDNAIDSIQKGRMLSAWHRSRVSEANTGKIVSPRTRLLLSRSMKGVKNFLGKKHSPETIEKMRMSAIARESRKHEHKDI